MSDPLVWHRQFNRYTSPKFDPPKTWVKQRTLTLDQTPALRQMWKETHSYPAFAPSGGNLVETRIVPRAGQVFTLASTPFERAFSLLCGTGGLTPVINADYYVVGYVGEISDGEDIYVPKGRKFGLMDEIIESGKPVFVSKSNPDPARFERHDVGRLYVYNFLTDHEGCVFLLLSSRSKDGVAAPDIDPAMLFDLTKIAFALGKGAARYLVPKMINAARTGAATFRQAMISVEKRLLKRGATREAASIRVLSEEELAMVWGGSGTARPLTGGQMDKAIELMRDGKDVHVETIGQMRQLQGELGQLGVRSESSSHIVPQRPMGGAAGGEGPRELPGSFRDGRGTYRHDPAHAPGTKPYNAHNEFEHINITLRDGRSLAIIVTGAKSF